MILNYILFLIKINYITWLVGWSAFINVWRRVGGNFGWMYQSNFNKCRVTLSLPNPARKNSSNITVQNDSLENSSAMFNINKDTYKKTI